MSDKKLSFEEFSIRFREAIPHSFMEIEDVLKYLDDPLHVEIMNDSILAADVFYDSLPSSFPHLEGYINWSVPIRRILLDSLEALFAMEGKEEKFKEIAKTYNFWG